MNKILFNFKNEKAQMSQAFTYITIILVIGIIAIVGAKAVFTVFKTSCDVKYQEFTLKLNKFVDSYSDKGSVRFEYIAVPCDAKEVCFVNKDSLSNPSYSNSDSVIQSSVADGVYNIFVKREFTEPVGLSSKLVVGTSSDAMLCIIPKNGNIRLKFIGEGKTTRIEQG